MRLLGPALSFARPLPFLFRPLPLPGCLVSFRARLAPPLPWPLVRLRRCASGEPLVSLFERDLVIYGVVTLVLLFFQGGVFDWVTSLIVRLLGVEHYE